MEETPAILTEKLMLHIGNQTLSNFWRMLQQLDIFSKQLSSHGKSSNNVL